MRSRLMHTPVFSLPADCPPLCRWFCAPRRFAGRGIFLVVRRAQGFPAHPRRYRPSVEFLAACREIERDGVGIEIESHGGSVQ